MSLTLIKKSTHNCLQRLHQVSWNNFIQFWWNEILVFISNAWTRQGSDNSAVCEPKSPSLLPSQPLSDATMEWMCLPHVNLVAEGRSTEGRNQSHGKRNPVSSAADGVYMHSDTGIPLKWNINKKNRLTWWPIRFKMSGADVSHQCIIRFSFIILHFRYHGVSSNNSSFACSWLFGRLLWRESVDG